MEIKAPCPCCSGFGGPQADQYSVRVNQSGCMATKCSSGHSFAVVIQNLHHELLFDMGLHSLRAGYTREAVVNFESAFEELCRFFVTVCITNAGIPDSIQNQLNNSVRHSERSLGAYCACFTLATRAAAPVVPQKLVEFRNRVVHQGEIPTDAKVVEFGDSVLHCSRQIQRVIQEQFSQVSRDIASAQVEERAAHVTKGTYPIAFHLNSALEHLRVEDAPFRTTITHCLTYLENTGGATGGFSYQYPEGEVIPGKVPAPMKTFIQLSSTAGPVAGETEAPEGPRLT